MIRTSAGSYGIRAVIAGLALIVPLIAAPAANAADATQFDPGNIISDSIFYNPTLMSEADVQTFIQAKGAKCVAAAGGPACLKDYRESTAPRLADKYCGTTYQGGTNELASHILFNVALACGINPQVLLVTLQKEEALVTSTGPSAGMYKIAMGYGCPDTAACDTSYYGFFNQLYSASRQFQIYAKAPGSFNYRAGQVNSIAWKPTTTKDCGTSQVFIQSSATAGLYNYTPYRPNQAALINLYGQGDDCSSYGNRNFWVYFTDWFGSTTVSPAATSFVKAVYQDVLARQPSTGEAINWGKAVMAGMPHSQIAGAFVNSDEFRLLKIDEAYRTVLNREPEDSGRLSWLAGMRQGTLAPDDVSRIFFQTDEYYNIAGATDPLFVASVYQKIIQRPAVQAEIDYWSGLLRTYGRVGVVNLIWFSVETERARVATMYKAYLGRIPDDPGLVQWADFGLKNGDSALRSAILGSDEYGIRAISRYP